MPKENILCITMTNLSVNGPDKTTKAFKNHFQQYGSIAGIRLYYLDSTNYLLPLAVVYIDITDHPKLVEKIDRCPVILGQRATLRWWNALPLCGYCEHTSHTISACSAPWKRNMPRPESSKKSGQDDRHQRTKSPALSGRPGEPTIKPNNKMPEATVLPPVVQQPTQVTQTAAKTPILPPYAPLSQDTREMSNSKSSPAGQTVSAAKQSLNVQGIMTMSKMKKIFSALWEGAYDEMIAKRQENRQSNKKMEGLKEEGLSLMDDIFPYS